MLYTLLEIFSKNHIHTICTEDPEDSWMFIGIYEHPKGINKNKTWAFLKQLADGIAGPWFLDGDFNEILDAN